MKKYLVGCINNDMKRSNTIKTRFFLVDNNKIKDVTQELCEGSKEITTYKYNKGLANYPFGCGLSHYLQNNNLNKVKGLNLKDAEIMMLTLNDLKHILKVKNAFDSKIETNLLQYIKGE